MEDIIGTLLVWLSADGSVASGLTGACWGNHTGQD
jgi:hypothetical protein